MPTPSPAPSLIPAADMPALPPGWVWTTVGDVFSIIGGGTPSTSIEDYWDGNIPWITSADILGINNVAPKRYISEQAVKNSTTNLVPAGSIIVVTRVGLGKVVLIKKQLCFSQDSQALVQKEKGILPEYALYYLSQAVQVFKYQSRGTTIAGVTKKQLSSLPFPLPPLAEQHRIVAAIETQLTRLDAGVASLKAAKAKLKRYRASVLKAACEGRLVAQDANDEPADVLRLAARRQEAGGRRQGKRTEEPSDTVGLPELPTGWCWATVEQLIELLQYGTSVKADADKDHGVPILRMGNIQEGALDYINLKYIDPNKEDIAKYTLYPGDVLINRTNSPELVGKAGLFERDGVFVFASYLIRLRFLQGVIIPRYVTFSMNSEIGRQHIVKTKHQVAGQANINSQDIRSMPIPLPPLAEQRRIVAEVERLLSVVTALEATVTANLKRAERLRQSILKRAFEGKLVAQEAR